MIPLLKGIRVLEIGAVVMGPLIGQVLADLGAELVKLEPIAGDVARNAHPSRDGMGALFANNNRNKRAIALDLKHPDGMQALRSLVERSDVLIHNMRSDAAQRLGIGFADAAALNPRLVYCAAIGFGQRGRYRDRPAYDDIVQAAGGLAGLMQEAMGEAPRFAPTILADKVGALHGVYGILAALVARGRGHAQAIEVEVPMFESLASFLLNEHLAEATFEDTGALGYPRVLSPHRRPHRTRDGWIAALPYTGEQWRRFLHEIGRSDVAAQPWFGDPQQRSQHVEELYGVMSAALPHRDTDTWIAQLTALDIPCARIASLQDLLHDPHLQDIRFFDTPPDYPPHLKRMLPQPVHFGAIAPCPDQPPPPLGAHTREVLAECGFDAERIARMFAGGVACETPSTPSAEPHQGATD